MVYKAIKVYGVEDDDSEVFLYTIATLDSDTTEPPEPEDDPIAAIVIAKPSLTVRSSPKVVNDPSNAVDKFQTGEQIWVSAQTYATDGDDYIWRQVIKVNGSGDDRVGKYVAEQNRDNTVRFLDLKEDKPNPPASRIWGSKGLIVGSQFIPVFTKNKAIHPVFMANKRPLAFEGKNIKPFEHSTTHYRDFTLERLKLAGINTIRFYFPLIGYSDDWLIDRMKEALDLLEGRFTAFITLLDCVDGRPNAPHVFTEDAGFYNGGFLHKSYFTGKHYKQRMLPAATKLAKALKDRDVFAYGVANEPKAYGGAASDAEQQAVIDFLHEVADMLHTESPNSLVTPGLLNISHLHNGHGTIGSLWSRVYDGRFDFAGFNMYEKEGQQPGADWEHEKLAIQYDLPFSRQDMIPLLNTEAWRHNENPDGTEAIKRKWSQWGYNYGVELSGWAADFGPDRNVTDKAHGWSAAFDPQWEGSLAYIADVYYGQRKQAYGVNW